MNLDLKPHVTKLQLAVRKATVPYDDSVPSCGARGSCSSVPWPGWV